MTTQDLKAKAQAHGMCNLSDAELIALQLDTSHEAARAILRDFGSIRNVLKNHTHRLTQAQAFRAELTLELAKRFHAERLQRADVLTDPDAVRLYLTARLRDLLHETFACIFLDNRHRVIKYEELFFGTIDGASVHPREIVRRALHHNTAAVILAHNHPSGVAEPSQADERITQKLKDALHLIDVRVLDHFVIGENIVSFAERGLL